MDSLRMEVVARGVNRMIEDLASIDASVEFSSVVDTIALRVTTGALRGTRAAKVASIRRSHEGATFTTMDGKLYKLSNYFHNDALWSRIQNKRAASLQTKLAARGLAKQSWAHLGAKISATARSGPRAPAPVPAYVASANYKGRQYPEDASTFSSGDGRGYSRTIVNASPLMPGARGETALYRSMQGEELYYQRLCANRFYQSAATRAAKYPGIFTKPSALASAVPVGMFGGDRGD